MAHFWGAASLTVTTTTTAIIKIMFWVWLYSPCNCWSFPFWGLGCLCVVSWQGFVTEMSSGRFTKSSLTSWPHTVTPSSPSLSETLSYCTVTLSVSFNMVLFSLSPLVCHQVCYNVRSVLFSGQRKWKVSVPRFRVVRRWNSAPCLFFPCTVFY